tara:strand:+ start:1612 stop:2970 length:1359 start_codon:yes stop_codon:yes gene_type:complete
MTKKEHKGVFGIIFLTIFLDMVGFSIIFPLFPEMMDHYLSDSKDGIASSLNSFLENFADSEEPGEANESKGIFRRETVIFGGILGSLFAILQFICAPIWGRLSDRIGRKKVLFVTVGLTSAGYLLWAFASHFWILLLSRVVGGLASGNLSVATAAIADITPRNKRAKGMAVVGVAFGLGFIMGPAIGGFCSLYDLTKVSALANLGLNPFSLAAFASFALALLNWGLVIFVFRETLAPEKRSKNNDRPSIFELGKIEHPAIRRTCLSYFWYMISFSGMEFTLTFLAVDRFRFEPHEIAWMFVFIGLTLIFVQGLAVRRLVNPVGERNLAMIGIVLGTIAFFILSQAGLNNQGGEEWKFSNIPLFYAGLLLMSAGVALISPCLTAMTSLFSTENKQGLHLGVFRSAGSLARATGPILAAVIYFQFGSATAYLAGACLLALPLIFLAKVPQPDKS